MSQADDLLNGLSQGDIALYTARPEVEPHIVIGEDRFITVPEELKRIAVQFDHNIETVTFDCPRYWDEHDMSKMKIYINFMRKDMERGCFIAENITVDDADERIMHFDWRITREATLSEGPLLFLVCVKKVDGEGYETNHWNSELSEDCYVSKGLECVEAIFAEYPDVIAQLLLRMETTEARTSEEAMHGYLRDYLAEDTEMSNTLKDYVRDYLAGDDEVKTTIENYLNSLSADQLFVVSDTKPAKTCLWFNTSIN